MLVNDFSFRSKKLQVRNKQAQAMINKSPLVEIAKVMENIDLYFSNPSNGGYKMIKNHFCHTYNKELRNKPNMHINAIREEYANKQESHERNLLSAISDTTLIIMVNEC